MSTPRVVFRTLAIIIVASLLVACWAPEPQFIIVTRAPQGATCPPQATRVVTRLVTTTPPPPTPGSAPPSLALHVLLLPGTQGDMAVRDRLRDLLANASSLEVELSVPDSETESVQAICGGSADLVWLSAPAYVVAHEACGATARFTVMRNGSASQRAEIMAQTDALRQARKLRPIRSLADLDGAVLGYTQALSMIGHIAPKAMLIEAGVATREELFLGGDVQAALAVYRGEVDAAAATWRPLCEDGTLGDARVWLLPTMPDAAQRIKILRLSEPIPNEVIAFRPALSASLAEKLVLALVSVASSPEGSELLDELNGISGLLPSNDADYNVVRRMGKALGLDFGEMLAGRALY